MHDQEIIKELIRFRSISSFCSHDYFSLLGRIHSHLELIGLEHEEKLNSAPELQKSFAELKTLLDHCFTTSKSVLKENYCQTSFIWIATTNQNWSASNFLKDNSLIEVFNDPKTLLEKRKVYRPHLFLVETQFTDNIEDLLNKLGSGLFKTILTDPHNSKKFEVDLTLNLSEISRQSLEENWPQIQKLLNS